MDTLRWILSATRGKLLQGSHVSRISGISTDSRRIKPGELFIPLKGKRFDGHKFINFALKKGAAGALTSKAVKVTVKGKAVIRVNDTLTAYHNIAFANRKKYGLPVIGITGSSGKTTTKDMLAEVLSKAGKTLKTEENFNNEIGVPQALLKLNNSHKFAVIEMAMQGIGEIEALARIALPNIAIVTNIGSAHMEHLISEDNIARAKSEILKFQKKNDIAILPADDKYFRFLKRRARSKVISFGMNNDADISARNIRFESDSSYFLLRTKRFAVGIYLPLPGKHNIYDALAAAAAAYALNIGPDHIKKGLETFKLSDKRLNIISTKHMKIIDDTYNANPDSMAASLNILENYPPRRIAVLGDMLELGPIARKSHENIGELAANLNIDALITVGKLGKYVAKSAKSHGLRNIHVIKSNREAVRLLKKLLRPNDTILVKGSRGMHMEEIVEGISRA